MDSQAVIAILCGVNGIVNEVLRDELGLASSFQPGSALTTIVEAHSLPQAVRFLRVIRESHWAVDCKLQIALPDELVSLFFTGYTNDCGVIIIGAREALSRESLLRELTTMARPNFRGVQVSSQEPAGNARFDRVATVEMMAHDLRNPLNGILAATQYLLEDAADLLETAHMMLLRSIESCSRNMFRVVEDLLEIASLESGDAKLNLTATDIRAIIQRNLEAHRLPAERKQVRLEVFTADRLPSIAVDPVRISRVIDTLLTNIIESSNSGSKIDISVGIKDEQLVMSLRTRTLVDALRLTSHPHQLGGERASIVAVPLAFRVVERIVEAHGGSLRTERNTGNGLTFTLALPAFKAPRKMEGKAETVCGAGSGRSGAGSARAAG